MFKKIILICSLFSVFALTSNGAFAFWGKDKCCDPCDPCCGKGPKEVVKKKVTKPAVVESAKVKTTEEEIKPTISESKTESEKVIEQEVGLTTQEKVSETVTNTERKETNYYPGLW